MNAVEIAAIGQVCGVVFDIQRYSLNDGPGLRTNVFLKGCSLRCRWCSNPESQNSYPEIAFFERTCFLCGDCLPVCERQAIQIQDHQLQWNRITCDQCGDCTDVCLPHAFTLIGKEIKAAEVLAEVMRDAAFYGGHGGITLTGGEPTLQAEFAEALLRSAKLEGLHTAIETCGASPRQNLERLLPFLDLILFDLKHMDAEIHRQFTGAENTIILDNIRWIARQNVELIIRIPLIPGFNTERKCLIAMAEFIRSLHTVREIQILSYHTLGKAKYRALGVPYLLEQVPPMAEEEAASLAGIFRDYGFEVTVGG
jgi:pyruvate formate lyase activating enzyme